MNQVAATDIGDTKSGGLKGWHVLLIMLGFFGIMFAVNGVFLYHAITSYPGEDIKKSYVQGLNYNETLAERSVQAARGWRAEVGLQEQYLVFRLRDGQAAPLSNLAVIGTVRRAATSTKDQTLQFRPVGAGAYRAANAELGAGQWQVQIQVYDPADQTQLFDVHKTIFVP